MRIVINGVAALDVEKEVVNHILLQHLLNEAELTPRERMVVDMRLADADFEEIGAKFYVTTYRIKQIHAKALLKLRKYVRKLAKQEHKRAHIKRLQAMGR